MEYNGEIELEDDLKCLQGLLKTMDNARYGTSFRLLVNTVFLMCLIYPWL